jgi:hypothetical protein
MDDAREPSCRTPDWDSRSGRAPVAAAPAVRFAIEYHRVEAWSAAVPLGWTGRAATARLAEEVAGGEHVETIRCDGESTPLVRENVEALERTGLKRPRRWTTYLAADCAGRS